LRGQKPERFSGVSDIHINKLLHVSKCVEEWTGTPLNLQRQTTEKGLAARLYISPGDLAFSRSIDLAGQCIDSWHFLQSTASMKLSRSSFTPVANRGVFSPFRVIRLETEPPKIRTKRT
jgi:hypothetical protein